MRIPEIKALTLIAYSSSEFPTAVGDGVMTLLVGVVGAEDEKKGLVVKAEASPPKPAPLGDPAPLTSGGYFFKPIPRSARAGSGLIGSTWCLQSLTSAKAPRPRSLIMAY